MNVARTGAPGGYVMPPLPRGRIFAGEG
jgi:hypothetical protein